MKQVMHHDVFIYYIFFTSGIQALQLHWKKCVDHKGDYVKK